MKDIGVSLGLVLVIEGLLWAAFPGLARRLLESMAVAHEQHVRTLGVLALATGVAVVWLFRG
jgi:uncharacterized protein YjeT (DUF2065 family)